MNRDPRDLIKAYYTPSSREPQIITIPTLNFLMIDGHGDPNSDPSYTSAITALYTLSYTLKFSLKKEGTPDFKVFPLEGLWWADDMSTFLSGDKSAWDWTMMIAQPDWIRRDHVEQASEKASNAGKADRNVLKNVRFDSFEEGPVVQLMHIGPYSTEGPNISRIHAFAGEQGYQLRGKHHEIYLGDPNRTTPENLKTIIRQPVHIP